MVLSYTKSISINFLKIFINWIIIHLLKRKILHAIIILVISCDIYIYTPLKPTSVGYCGWSSFRVWALSLIKNSARRNNINAAKTIVTKKKIFPWNDIDTVPHGMTCVAKYDTPLNAWMWMMIRCVQFSWVGGK